MKVPLSIALLAGLAFAGCSRPEDSRVEMRDAVAGNHSIIDFEDDDAQMNAAMEQARSTLNEFERRLSNPPATQTEIGLKGRFQSGKIVEHMWVGDITLAGDGYHGRLKNDPDHLPSLVYGQAVVVPRASVSDWFAVDAGKLVGGYTMRVIRSRLSPEDRIRFDAENSVHVTD